MSYLKFGLILIFFAVLGICSCEYEPDGENISTIQKPSPTHQFDLSLVNQGDTIKLFRKTDFNYNLNTYGVNIKQAKFTLNGKTWNVFSATGFFSINPQDFAVGYDTLSFSIYTNTGSGSIADRLGAEAYKAVKKWVVLIDGREGPLLKLSKSITKEGYLKISWNKCDQYNFISYNITGNGTQSIKDPNCTSIIDSLYIGGEKTFNLRVIVSTDIGYNNEASIGMDDSIPFLKFTEIGVDSIRISWKKSKYKAKYRLNIFTTSPDTTIFETTNDSFYTISQPGFGERTGYTLYTSPYHLNSITTPYTKKDQKYYAIGNLITGNWNGCGYNQIEKVLYTNTYSNIECYNISTLSLKNTFNISGNRGLYSCPTNSTKVAAISYDNIYVFANQNLKNPEIIPYNSSANYVDHFYLTDNDLIGIAIPNKYELISLSQKKVISTINITDYPIYSKWACITTSQNGKYTCIATLNGIQIYNIQDSIPTLSYSDSRSYRSALFNVNNANELFLTLSDNNQLEIRNVFDFSLANSIVLPANGVVLRNIDPESGFLLTDNYKKFYIVDLIKQQVIFSMNSSGNITKLYGNRLFSSSGYTFDISKYLPK